LPRGWGAGGERCRRGGVRGRPAERAWRWATGWRQEATTRGGARPGPLSGRDLTDGCWASSGGGGAAWGRDPLGVAYGVGSEDRVAPYNAGGGTCVRGHGGKSGHPLFSSLSLQRRSGDGLWGTAYPVPRCSQQPPTPPSHPTLSIHATTVLLSLFPPSHPPSSILPCFPLPLLPPPPPSAWRPAG